MQEQERERKKKEEEKIKKEAERIKNIKPVITNSDHLTNINI